MIPWFIKYVVKEILLSPIVKVRGKKGYNRVALTFDDGPNPRYTPRVLEILQTYSVTATFFLVGNNIEKYPELAREIVHGGHEVGCHTLNHKKLSSASLSLLNEEVGKFFEIFDWAQRILRPPHGKLGLNLLYYAWYRKIPIVLWSLDPKDFRSSEAQLIEFFSKKPIKDGDIVLLHDKTIELIRILPRIIENCQKRNLSLVKVSNLAATREIKRI